MIRLATVGTSQITKGFIGGCLLAGEYTLAAVYSRDHERGRDFGALFGCNRVICDINELAAAEDIDAVYIASPNAFHVAQSMLMLNHGKHVICEKPVVVSCSQLYELQKTADENGVIFMEAIIPRHLPARNTVLETIQKLGSITHARFDFSQLSSRYENYRAGRAENIFDPKMAAGTFMDLGIYCVYLAADFFGLPDNVCAAKVNLTTGADGIGAALLTYKDKMVTLSYNKLANGGAGSEIAGDKGVLKIGSVSKLTDVSFVSNDGKAEKLVGDFTKEELMSGEAKSFANYIVRRPQFESDYRAASALAITVHTIMDEIRKSANITFNMEELR